MVGRAMPIDQHCVQSLQRSCPAEVAGDDLGGKVDCRGSARTCDHVVVNDRSLFGRGPDIGKHGFKIRLVSQMNATLPARHKT